MNDLATKKICPGRCKVDQIGIRGKIHAFVFSVYNWMDGVIRTA